MTNLIFNYPVIKNNEIVGDIITYQIIGDVAVYRHPEDSKGGQLHLFIKPQWRKKWLTKGLAKEMLNNLIEYAKLHDISIVYSTALTSISPRILEFFGFTEYYKKQPKTYYYLKI